MIRVIQRGVLPGLLSVLVATDSAFAETVDSAAAVADAPGLVVLEGARIRGNQELPNVLYIVPWRPLEQPGLEAPQGVLINPSRQEPLYREEFVRLVDYHDRFLQQHKPREATSTP